jgi:hypothetical protein
VIFYTPILVFKMKNGMMPNYMQNDEEMQLPERYETRTIICQKTSAQNMIWHNGLRMFNELPPSVKQGRNLDEFKYQIFEIMRDQFPV